VWLVYYKKSSGQLSVSYAEAVEEALCFGWIDSKALSIDQDKYQQYFTVRKPKSVWSQVNKERVERLIAQGLIMPAGLEKIRIAQENGSWTSLDAIEALEVPPDFQAALNAKPLARTNYEAFSKTAKKGILRWITGNKNPEIRQQRMQEIIRLAEQNIPYDYLNRSKTK
jgi:uncharacterized protein YdeI (YjbR/CyaY-like superfamily)